MPARATATATDPLQDRLERLVDAHTKRKTEPLHLAVRFFPLRGARHIHLFEVLGNFGGGSISHDHKLFEVSFGSTPAFPLDPDTELRMVLTSPEELKTAIHDEWASLKRIRASVRDRSAELLWADAVGKSLWRLLK
jgi:hypothetical protein